MTEENSQVSKLENNQAVNAMLKHVTASNCSIVSQQRGDEELSNDDKMNRLMQILHHQPATFLFRFGQYLNPSHLKYFEQFHDNFTISHYLRQIKEGLDDSKMKVRVRNRRYECLQRLIEDGNYFDDEEMRKRCPYLYEQYIGQYLSADEKNEIALRHSAVSLSGYLHYLLDESETKALLEHRRKREEEITEEEEDDDDEDDNDPDKNEQTKVISDEEKTRSRQEFVNIMKTRFLNGEDTEFDYGKIDYDVEYDSLKVRTQDEEDRYFDGEDSETCSDYQNENDDNVIDYDDERFVTDTN
ncbi:Coiled-coil domain-containing protein 97 [Trichoplax sp. H2]|uniref:CCD97-like C-terminal domain-containing protein n=1 Tax=Trichoplax adhaerens TaxID=10228 RepID=B3SCN5_TRIAD|nr:hypothetical protein TRIADDRAFT_33385 [Trichoplax adhaerens]EDV19504.1 hypothetical protein TRIADDRAFT_33385 [Trichoplax adhaerens]RDD37747.1 Coiled-coil domain-containing protein 97 [Trichoplax sp. H2]|eukprot:XP_002118021.1 hypothetical protein TRIADDRAFT_33385 [Trichoplax adhaerens]